MALKHWVWLSQRAGIGSRTAMQLLLHFGTPERIYFADENELRITGILSGPLYTAFTDKDITKARIIVDKCDENNFRIITINDAEYPERLRNIYDPPILIYVAGHLPIIDEEAAVAIVGTRKCTIYGTKTAERMGYEITCSGGIVVSGLARGIDSAAVRGALRAGGRAVGVLGTGIDIVYPAENRSLFRDVVSVGALVSEYPPGTPPARGSFPARNRIISGLSVGVLVIEAPKKSGALITAARALEQGRDVFAVPGNADSEACAGSNELLREGATFAVCGGDIISEYINRFPSKLVYGEKSRSLIPHEKRDSEADEDTQNSGEKPVPALKNEIDNKKSVDYIDLVIERASLSDSELRVIAVMKTGDMHVDEIIAESGIDVSSVLSALTLLQIKGAVSQKNGKRFALIASFK